MAWSSSQAGQVDGKVLACITDPLLGPGVCDIWLTLLVGQTMLHS